jgi:hypothetical protein
MRAVCLRIAVGIAFGALVAGLVGSSNARAATEASAWTVVANPHQGTLTGVTSLAPADVWSVGFFWSQQAGAYRSLAEHWNGSAWSAMVPPRGSPGDNVLNAVSGSASNDVWAVGHQARRFQSYPTVPLAVHWNGTAWSVARTPAVSGSGDLHGVAALAPDDVWAVGELGSSNGPLIEHFDGTAWTLAASPDLPGFAELNAIAARSPNDIWAVGSYADGTGVTATLTEHFDGSTWSVVPSPNSDEYNQLTGVALSRTGSGAWASGNRNPEVGYFTLTERFDGSRWTISQTPDVGAPNNELNAVTVLPNGVAYTVGYKSQPSVGPLIERWNGSAWTVDALPATPFGALLWGTTSSTDNTIWAVGDNLILRRSG